MSGHSHWAGIKHRKGINDAKRAKIFTKYAKLLSIAARGGTDPSTNFKLRLAIDAARSVNMPKENIERAIKAGAGEKRGAAAEEAVYEAYLPIRQMDGSGQVAFIIEAATDNKNRTVGEIKTIFSKNGGKVVPSGSVSFLFTYAGIIAFAIGQYPVDALEEMAIESGADDFRVEDDLFLVITKPEKLQSVRTFFETKNILPESAELGYIPTQTISLSGEDLMRYENITGLLEDNIDIQTVWNNVH